MKKLMILILACLLLVSLCACGKNQQETPDTTAGTVADDIADPNEDTPNPSAQLALAKTCINKPVAELYALVGQPITSDYAPSCMGEGEDGNLYYDGFIVYTYREGDTESVYYVE